MKLTLEILLRNQDNYIKSVGHLDDIQSDTRGQIAEGETSDVTRLGFGPNYSIGRQSGRCQTHRKNSSSCPWVGPNPGWLAEIIAQKRKS